MSTLKQMTREELEAYAVEIGMATAEQAEKYANKDLLIEAIEAFEASEDDTTDESEETTVEETKENTTEEDTEKDTTVEATKEDTETNTVKDSESVYPKRDPERELAIMERFGIDTIWLNNKSEYFTALDKAILSGDKKPLEITKESLTSKQ